MQPIKIGLIGGSGLGEALHARENGTPLYVNTPFGKPSSTLIETRWADLPILVLSRHGNGHVYNPSAVPYRANIYALKTLGCTHILASGAVGSLREEFRPRDVVVPDQVIDKTHRRPATFFDQSAVHVEFAEPFCPVLRQILKEVSPAAIASRAASSPMTVHHGGCYVAMEGPAFSTRSESLMHRIWGGDLIGMTAMPEARLAREAEIPYALVSLVTDYDSWRGAIPGNKIKTDLAASFPAEPAAQQQQKHELLNEIIGNLQAASENAIALMQSAVERIARDPAVLENCPASSALELAIWSNKEKLPQEEIERLWPLWGRYFPRS